MKCPRCQAENEQNARFCEDCGARIELACPSCGQPVGVGKKFCRSCGAVLTPTASLADSASRFSSPESYTPKHLAEKILTSKAALEGERKQVTVLFADLKGSMELLADRDPEEARKLLDPVLERMMEAVHRYEGTVNQVMGDGIMALFGAPLAHEDHALRACYAALAMQTAIRNYAEDVERTHGVDVQIRVGLNSGEVVVRTIGSDLRIDYSAVGQTTHMAARMEQLATPGQIWLTANTSRFAEGFIRVTSLGVMPIKGSAEPAEVFELLEALPTRTRMQAIAARGLTPLVARETELEMLSQALKRAGAGHGQIFAVVGELGVGKSRLAWEFTHSPRTQGWLVLESVSVSYGRATSYRPLIDLLRAYFQIEDHDDPPRIGEKVTGKLLSVDLAMEGALPALLSLLDVPVTEPEWQALDPPQRRQLTLEAAKRLLLSDSQAQPVLVIFEDLQWIDAETQAFLDGLVESLPTARLLLLVNYRPEYQHGWAGKTYYRQLHLDPLPPESAQQLLQAILGNDISLEPLRQRLITTTEGNPFFLEESVRTLVETRALVGQRGAFRLAHPLPAIQVPDTVHAMLAARIDRLPPDAKRLLHSAAVIGKDVPLALLEAVADLPADELRRGLADLQAAEFLYQARLFPDLEYTFKHALTHEVAYTTVLQERRRGLHARIVEAIEKLYPDRLGERVERLAQHALRGELWDKALSYLRQAGAKAYGRSANREAVAWFEQALEVLKHLPDSQASHGQGVDIRFDLRGPLTALGEFGRVAENLRAAEGAAQALGDERRLGRVYGYLTAFFVLMGDHDRAAGLGQRALAIAEAVGELDVRVVANNCLGDVYVALGQFRPAIEFSCRNRDSLDGDLVRERFGLTVVPAVSARTRIAWCLTEMGQFAEAIASAVDATRIAEMVRHPYSRIWANFGLCWAYLQQGKFVDAIPPAEHSLALCQATDIRVLFPYVGGLLGAAYVYSGRLSDALPLIERAIEVGSALRVGQARSMLVALLSEAYLLSGRTAAAAETAPVALELARAHRERAFEAWSLRLFGEIESHRESPNLAIADDHYRQAMALAIELGMRPLVAHCHLGLGKLYARTSEREQAQEHLAKATQMYREMDMRFWLEQAETEMRQAG